MSKCQICKANESRVDITLDVVQGKFDIQLCKECAATYKLDMETLEKGSLEPFLRKGIALGQILAGDGVESENKSCPNCGMTGDDVAESGTVGCPFCYFVFSNLPEVQQRASAGSSFLPDYVSEGADGYQESLEVLQRRLDEAIASERFEVAAELRDQINARL